MQTTRISLSPILDSFLESLKNERFMAHHGSVQNSWIVFETCDEAAAAFRAAGAYKADGRDQDVMESAFRQIHGSAIEFNYKQLDRRLRIQMKWTWRKRKISSRAFYGSAATSALNLALCIVAWGNPSHAGTKYMLERWNVWQQGFALLGENKGKLYVFRRY
jgi:hypothetical protein